MRKTVTAFISVISDIFDSTMKPDTFELLMQYNKVVRSLYLMLPLSDASVTLTAKKGKISTALLGKQVRRVFFGENELLRASSELVSLLPDAFLYHAEDDTVYVSRDGEYTIYYRTVPKDVDSDTASLTYIPEDPLMQTVISAYIMRYVYAFVGDIDTANGYANEYNSLLEDFKKENGVSE